MNAKTNPVYLPKSFVVANLPHSNRAGETLWTRRANDYVLNVRANPNLGLPYASYPRLFLMWLTRRILITGQRRIELDESYHSFLAGLGLSPDGHTRRRFYDQVTRLLASTIAFGRMSGVIEQMRVAVEFELWWDPKRPYERSLFQTEIHVTAEFYLHAAQSSVPLRPDAVCVLKRSSLAIDLYAWLTYRFSYLRTATAVPLCALFCQFGADYSRLRFFKRALRENLIRVLAVYPDAKVELEARHLILKPSPPSVPQ
ncbi:hypothetical protein HY522_02990 [bacterium]|nr:hypothetical protein [bacterium]